MTRTRSGLRLRTISRQCPWSARRLYVQLQRLIWLVLLMPVLLLPTPGLAAVCNLKTASVSLSVIPQYGEIIRNHGHSALQLATKFGQRGENARRQGWIMRGLTRTDMERHLNVGITYRNRNSSGICAALTGITLKIGFRQFRVYIARKLKPGSCEYRTTLAHERTHVRIYQSALRKYLPEIRSVLRRSVDSLQPVEAASPVPAQRYFLARIERDLAPTLARMNSETETLNGHMDTPENYRREQALCPS